MNIQAEHDEDYDTKADTGVKRKKLRRLAVQEEEEPSSSKATPEQL